MNLEYSSQSPESERVSFKPGGPLEHMGGMSARFGGIEVQIIASPDDPKICFITGLRGKNAAGVVQDIARAIKEAGFRSVDYRPDNEDGRAEARARLFAPLKKQIQETLSGS